MSLPPVIHASWAMIGLSLVFLLPTLYFILAARRGKELYIRRIPGIDAIEEAIGRATELGRPIVFTTGLSGLGPLLFATLGILTHIAKKAAAFGCRLILPQNDYTVMPIVEETAREAYRSAGHLDQFNPQEIRFLSDQQFAFASGYMGIVHREKAACCFMFGDFAAESLILAEAGQQVGAMQVAGTPSFNQIPFFITSCDYTLIGEEVYAAGAYLSRDPAQLGSIRGQDAAKLATLGLIAAGLAVGTFLSLKHSDTKEGATYYSPLKEAIYAQPQQARALARFEIVNQYQPGSPPEWGDLEEDLAAARARLSRDARFVSGQLKRIAQLAKAQEHSIRGSLGLFEAGAARTQAEQMADGLKDIVTRADKGAKTLADLAGTKLPAIEKDIAGRRGVRSGEAAKAELACLRAWAAKQPGPEGEACRKLLDAADQAVAKGTISGIERAVKSARGACYRTHLVQIRAIMDRIEAASKGNQPVYLLRTAEGGKIFRELRRKEATARVGQDLEGNEEHKKLPEADRKKKLEEAVENALGEEAGRVGGSASALLLDGEKSVSGRLLPLTFAWTVWSPGEPKPERKYEAEAELARKFDKPGFYKLGLAVSEKQEPLTLPLALGGAERSSLPHQTVARGVEIKFTCPLAKTVVPEDVAIKWDLDGDGTFEAHDSTATYRCDKAGRYVITMEAEYREKIEAEVREPARASSDRARVPGAVAGLRRRLGVELPDIAERLADVNGRLGRMLGEAKNYGVPLEPLDYAKGLTKDSWPDRDAAGEAVKSIEDLRDWSVKKANRFLLQAAANADNLGEGPAAPAVASAAAAGASGGAGQPKAEEVGRFKRFRIHLTVVAPEEDAKEMTVRVDEAPEFPRAPWEPPPAGPAEGTGGGR